MQIEIMFTDLSESKQVELLEAYDIVFFEEMNWDVIPLVILETEPNNTT